MDKVYDFRRITLFCLKKRLSKYKMTIFSKHLGRGMAPLAPPGIRLCFTLKFNDIFVVYLNIIEGSGQSATGEELADKVVRAFISTGFGLGTSRRQVA